MKRYSDYLVESTRTYAFRLKFAKELTDDMVNKLEQSLEKFGLETISSVTKTAIQQRPMDFQNISNEEIYIVDITVKYPSTPQIITSLIHQTLDIPESHISVMTKEFSDNVELDLEEIPAKRKKKTSLLDTPMDEVTDPPQYGDRFNREFLAKLKSTLNGNPTGPKRSKAEMSTDLPQGTTSPIGTHKNALPTVKSNAR